MPLRIVNQDITEIHADALVNAANTRLAMGSGVCGAIFRAAGSKEMEAACAQVGSCAPGCAVATPAFRLPARTVIHTVGPVWEGGVRGEREVLASCYRSSLALARKLGLRSIAFPLISSGAYGYPKEEAYEVAVEAIRSFLDALPEEEDLMVILDVFDKGAVPVPEELRRELEEKGDEEEDIFKVSLYDNHQMYSLPALRSVGRGRVSRLDSKSLWAAMDLNADPVPTFQQMLLEKIRNKGLQEPQVYRKANLDRKLFSKIRKNVEYHPAKTTALALAIALELDLEETKEILKQAGYALSPSIRADRIVKWFIDKGQYDIFEINDALFYYGQPLLGL